MSVVQGRPLDVPVQGSPGVVYECVVAGTTQIAAMVVDGLRGEYVDVEQYSWSWGVSSAA